MDDAQKARWTYFQKTLNIEYLRAYLKRLPDFEDFEAERKAFAIAAAHRSAETALTLFVAWPDLQRADRLVRERLTELDGAAYYTLRPAAEALEEKYPAALPDFIAACWKASSIGARRSCTRMRQEICCRVPGLPIISVRNRASKTTQGS
jgi:hypothetical protein